MERIPKRLLDKKGQLIVDMPLAASFISDERGSHTITLESAEHRTKPNGADERIPGTGLTIVIEGGKRLIDNSEIFEALMNNQVFRNGRVRIDPEDPTGFWRELGILKTVERETVVAAGIGRNPEFDDDLAKRVKALKKSEKVYKPIVVTN